MALIIEDGSVVDNANSYNSLAEARAYAADRGVVLSVDDAVLTPILIKATDYIESFSDRFVGMLTDVDQALSWPRKNTVKSDGSAFPDNEIPTGIKSAQCQLCIEQVNGIVLMPTIDPETNGKFVVREKVDVLETQYSDKFGAVSAPIMPAVEALLSKYLVGGNTLRVVRI